MPVENPMQEFETLALLSSVTSLTDRYLDVQDVTFAEFLVDICTTSGSKEEFVKNLAVREITSLNPDLIDSLYTLVHSDSNHKNRSRTEPQAKRSRWYNDPPAVDREAAKHQPEAKWNDPEWQHTDAAKQAASKFNDPLDESEFIVQLNRQDPSFLRGHSRSSTQFSPIRVVKNPQGSLLRAAQSGSALLKGSVEGKVAQRELSQEQNVIDDPAGCLATDALPIEQFKGALLDAIKQNQVLVVVGETGSGKTTKIPQYLHSAGYTNSHTNSSRRPDGSNDKSRPHNLLQSCCIACTQPRRLAAVSVAKRVARELQCRLGSTVGYSIRFDERSSAETRIRYMTDGMLLRECLLDPLLSRYSVIILDEAHERTLNTDVLFGLLKRTLQERPSLRLLVTSATLEAEKFCAYFGGCPLFHIPGRTFPVQVMYTREPELDYLQATVRAVQQVHQNEPPGDLLVFLTGQEEIETACAIVQSDPSLLALPLYASQPGHLQALAFQPAPPGIRKVILATNVAETSLTIPGIRYVIDSGMCKQKVYNPRLGMDSLQVIPISQAQAVQRAGRAGRTGPGKCFRLFTERAFQEEMIPATVPEVQRTCLTNTLLQLKVMGIQDSLSFDWMDPPSFQAQLAALHQLYSLGALDEDGFVTLLGRRMAQLPLDPPLAKTLLHSVDEGCLQDIVTLVAMLSTQLSLFYRPRGKEEDADRIRARFTNPIGDHLTLLNVYRRWSDAGCTTQWCHDHYLNHRALLQARDIRSQLSRQLSHLLPSLCADRMDNSRDERGIVRSVVAGFFMHVAKRDSHDGGYRTLLDRTEVYVHPSSSLFQRTVGHQADWLVYHELMCTTREWMREVSRIDPRWLPELAPGYYRTGSGNGQEKGANEMRKLKPLGNGNDDWRPSKMRAVRVSQRF